MTDSSGTVVWAADYKPFGEATITVSTITNNLRFPGQYYDAETGLHQNGFRDYNLNGRYIETDPIGILKGINHLYVYVTNKPISKVDINGLVSSVLTFDEVKKLVQSNNRARPTFSDNWIICLIWYESTFHPVNQSPTSSARGLMSMTKTAINEVNKYEGNNFSHDEMADTVKNIQAGTEYLSILATWPGDLTHNIKFAYGTGDKYPMAGFSTCESCLSNKECKDPMTCLYPLRK